MANEDIDDVDEDTEAEMLWRIAAHIDDRFDPPPEDLTTRVRGSFVWRTIDADLAAVADEPAVLAGVRADDAPQPIRFRDAATGEVVAAADYDRPSSTLLVDVYREGIDHLTLRSPSRPDVTLDLDTAGACRFVDVDGGPAQLIGTTADGSPAFKTEPTVIL